MDRKVMCVGWLLAVVMLGLGSRQVWADGVIRVAQVMQRGDALGEFPPTASTNKEKIKFANQAQEEMREAIVELNKRVDAARKAKDIVYLSCLNEKLSNLNAMLKVSETATILMQEAINRGDTEQVDLLFRKIYISLQKARQWLQEAEECSYQSEEVVATEGEGEAEIQEIQRPIQEFDEPLDPDESLDLGVDYYFCP
ncbi:hypothetical protein D6833_01420 [Candidatus Parcubacteria bacterium]|nr:MAG: hypothetical protein D6833_01420 [Candidatus Parcubacteria bacterium]